MVGLDSLKCSSMRVGSLAHRRGNDVGILRQNSVARSAGLRGPPLRIAPSSSGAHPSTSASAGRSSDPLRATAPTLSDAAEAEAPSAAGPPDHVIRHIERVRRPGIRRTLEGYFQKVDRINALEPAMRALSDKELRGLTDDFRRRLREKTDTLDSLLPEAFAAVREAARRSLGLRHYDVQLAGGMVLQDGCIAEMMTGEGKTLMATLPAYLNCLTGKGVHVVTVNDYLARRDCALMSRVYSFLGVRAAYVPTLGRENEDDEKSKGSEAQRESDSIEATLRAKRRAYSADITYVTSVELCFDYLRSNTADTIWDIYLERPLNFCIVDEADFVLIDSALQPMILSEPGGDFNDADMKRAYEVASSLVSEDELVYWRRVVAEESMWSADEAGARAAEVSAARAGLAAMADPSGGGYRWHYTSDKKNKQVTLTDFGARCAEEMLGIEDLWSPGHDLAAYLEAGLKAREHFIRDRDYIVKDNNVVIIDPGTGRAQPRTRWQQLIHPACEAKEGLPPKGESETLAQITYQAFFRMYDKLSGMSGTAQTEEEELFETYRLSVVPVPTNRPMIRVDRSPEVYSTDLYKYDAILELCVVSNETGRPILVGTGSVEESEILSGYMVEAGIKHEVLNARPEYEEKEAGIIAQAGSPGAVTISTNMAGRGTDIVLGGDPSGLVLEHLRTWLCLEALSREKRTKFIKRLRERTDESSSYRSWDFCFPLLSNPFGGGWASGNMTPERVTALGYLMNTRAVFMGSEGGMELEPKEIGLLLTKAIEIKELIKIRVRSLISSGSIQPTGSSSEYILLPNSPEAWAPVLADSLPSAGSDGVAVVPQASLGGPRGAAAQVAQIDVEWERSFRSQPAFVQALGKAAYVLEGLLSQVCDRRAEEVRGLGGLLVIATCVQQARRLENQLRGRAGRQGDPGETRVIISLEDPLIKVYGGDLFSQMSQLTGTSTTRQGLLEFLVAETFIRPVQKAIETYYYGIRSDTRAYGEVLAPYISFMYAWRKRALLASGRGERRYLHSVLQAKADELAARHLPDGARRHPSRWPAAALASLQSELLALMGSHTEGAAPFATAVEEREGATAVRIFVYSSPQLADLADLAAAAQCLAHGDPLPPPRPMSPPAWTLEAQSLFNERRARLVEGLGAKGSKKIGVAPLPIDFDSYVLSGGLPRDPRERDTGSTATVASSLADEMGIPPDDDPWMIRLRPAVEGPFAPSYEALRLHLGDLLISSFEERMAVAARSEGAVPLAAVQAQGLGKFLAAMKDAWKRFLAELDELRTTVGFRAYASLTPLEEYRIESAVLFVTMIRNIRLKAAENMLLFDFVVGSGDEAHVPNAAEAEGAEAASASNGAQNGQNGFGGDLGLESGSGVPLSAGSGAEAGSGASADSAEETRIRG